MMLDSVSFAAYQEMRDVGLIKDSEQDIVQIVLDQEVVTYCNAKYSVTFDVYDLVEE
jgi:hypothetical protein